MKSEWHSAPSVAQAKGAIVHSDVIFADGQVYIHADAKARERAKFQQRLSDAAVCVAKAAIVVFVSCAGYMLFDWLYIGELGGQCRSNATCDHDTLECRSVGKFEFRCMPRASKP